MLEGALLLGLALVGQGDFIPQLGELLLDLCDFRFDLGALLADLSSLLINLIDLLLALPLLLFQRLHLLFGSILGLLVSIGPVLAVLAGPDNGSQLDVDPRLLLVFVVDLFLDVGLFLAYLLGQPVQGSDLLP